MSEPHPQHAVSSPDGAYNLLRREVDPGELLAGLFYWHEYLNEMGVPPADRSALLAAPGPLVIRLDDLDRHVAAYVRLPGGDKLPETCTVKFQLNDRVDWPMREIPCRMLLLQPEVLDQLRQNLAAEGRPLPRDDEKAIRLLLAADFLKSSDEAARVLSSLPVLEGSVGPDGKGSASGSAPAGCSNILKEIQIIVVYEPSPAGGPR